MNEQDPWITWEESGTPKRARWRSESQDMPAALLPADDTLAANEVLPLVKIAQHVIDRLRSTSGLSMNRV